MKAAPVLSKFPLISIKGLALVYVLLCLLTVLLTRLFLSEILQDGKPPELLSMVIFLTIPAFLLFFLIISCLHILRNLLGRRIGARFQVLLLMYFIILVVLAAAPVTIITAQGAGELAVFWKKIRVVEAMEEAQRFALEAYSLNMEKLNTLIRRTDFNALLRLYDRAIPPGEDVLAKGFVVQEFVLGEDDSWQTSRYIGPEEKLLSVPPALEQGFISRQFPRDRDVARYVLSSSPGVLRVISYDLGEGFDQAIGIIESERGRFALLDSLTANIRLVLVFAYGVFFLPTLLMTLIIAISFSRRVTQPIVELAEATRQVAEGNFSVQILSRRGDELGLLVNSFNAMIRALEKSQSAMVKAEKISIWQSMAQQLAHEIKNPLTPIRLSAERVLRRWKNEPERIGEILENSMMAIVQEVEGLSTLLTEFRTLSRPLEPSRTFTELRELCEEAINPYISSYPYVRFDIDHVEAGIIIKIDKHRMAQILTNLIINGIDAMQSAGFIEIRTDLVKKRESRYCRLSIKDSGKGISREEGGKIFTPYYTTKESGTGLGLPIVERIVNDHGGAIWFNSAEGAGTTFFIDLPLEEAAEKSPREEPAPKIVEDRRQQL